MRLKDFIKTVLVDMNAGINEAAKETGKQAILLTYTKDGDGTRGIDFDVAVTASSEASGRAGAELNVVGVGSIGGKADAKLASEEVSRVKFTIVTELDSDREASRPLPEV